MKKRTPFLLSIIGVIILVFILNRQYPVSAFSLSKSFSYDADNIVVNQYMEDLNAFKKYYQTQVKAEDLTTDRMQYILEVYEMPLLTDKGPLKIKYEEIGFLLNDMKYVREILIDLAFQEEYDFETKEYLKHALESILHVEEEIANLQDSKFHSRKTLKRQLGNLRASLMSNFDAVVTFYKSYKNGR